MPLKPSVKRSTRQAIGGYDGDEGRWTGLKGKGKKGRAEPRLTRRGSPNRAERAGKKRGLEKEMVPSGGGACAIDLTILKEG